MFRILKMNRMRILFFSVFINAVILLSQTVNLPLGHWGYDVLERFEVRHALKGVLNNTKPMTRQEFVENIKKLNEYQQTHGDDLTNVEKEWIRELNFEFFDELDRDVPLGNSIDITKNSFIFKSWWPGVLYQNNRNFFDYHYKEFDFYFDIVFRISTYNGPFLGENGPRTLLSNGGTFRGRLGNSLGYYFDFTDNTIMGKTDIDRGVDILPNSGWTWLNTQDNERIMYDENIFYLMLNYKYLNFELGRDYTKWGPMKNGQLSVSSNSPAYDMFRMTFKIWRIKLTGVTGFPIHVADSMRSKFGLSVYEKKYLAASRLELDMGAGFQLGLNQMIVYGKRNIEIGYLIPFSFYKSSEHYYGDRDNGLIGFDFEWNIIKNYKIYGEFLFDDISTTKLWSDFYGNKFAWGLGTFSYNALWIDDLSMRLEYKHINPYVYTHKYDINKYKNYDSNLGHWMGPNSDLLNVDFSYWYSRKLWFDINYQYLRHGANPPDRNVGGDIDLAHSSKDSENAVFLDGILEQKLQYHFGINYEIFRRSVIFFTVGQMREFPEQSQLFMEFGWKLNYGQK